MKLQIETTNIKDVRKDEKTYINNGTLFVNVDNLKQLVLSDDRISSVDIEIFKPGDQVRIVNIMDTVQPRACVEKEESDFPGFVGPIKRAGNGVRKSLNNVYVITTNPETQRHYSAFTDMGGTASKFTKFAKSFNVCIAPHQAENVGETDFEFAVKRAGFVVAVALAEAAKDIEPDAIKVYDWSFEETFKIDPSLPRVAYYYQLYSPQHDNKGISDPCFYGTQINYLLPTIVHPNEILDGGIVGHTTYRALGTDAIQNHGVIEELYSRHGKDLCFCGVVCGVANLDPIQRNRKAMMASSLLKDFLCADGAVLTKIHGGMPHVDLALVAEECEKLGIKTTLTVQPLVSTGTLSATALFSSDILDAIVIVGATQEKLTINFKPQIIFGGTADSKIFNPDPFPQRAGDSIIVSEEFLIAGIHDHTGGAFISAKEY